MCVLLGGVPLTLAALGGGHALPFYLACVVLTASLVPIALFGPRTFLLQLAVIVPGWLVKPRAVPCIASSRRRFFMTGTISPSSAAKQFRVHRE